MCVGSTDAPTGGVPPMVLDDANGWFVVGPPSQQQVLHTVSLPLSQPHHISSVSLSLSLSLSLTHTHTHMYTLTHTHTHTCTYTHLYTHTLYSSNYM